MLCDSEAHDNESGDESDITLESALEDEFLANSHVRVTIEDQLAVAPFRFWQKRLE